jgi:uncharacterized protein with von Willebrand factor type A (vWA) domain
MKKVLMKFCFTIQQDEERKHFFSFITLMNTKHKLHIFESSAEMRFQNLKRGEREKSQLVE